MTVPFQNPVPADARRPDETSDDADTRSSRSRRRATPLTAFGVGIAVLGAASYVAGWRLGWIELLVVAAASLVALLLAIPFVVGGSRVHLARTHEPSRVHAGDTVSVLLTATNGGRAQSRRVVADERVGSRELSVSIPSLAPGAHFETNYEIPTDRRAKLQLGPAVITREDPLGLMRRDVSESDVNTCWVYPRTRHVSPLPVGFAKDLEGPTSDSSPAGDVAFHTIRPYQDGDDRRHIHWLTTAKTGELMVRHFVDNRRPHIAVLLDRGIEAFESTAAFETAVSVSASVASSMMQQQLPMSVRLGDDTVLGNYAPSDRESVLEALTVVDRDESDSTDLAVSAAEFVRLEPQASALVIVTGSRSAEDLLKSVVHVRRQVRVIIVHVLGHEESGGDDSDNAFTKRIAVPGARSIQVSSLDEFAAAWEIFA